MTLRTTSGTLEERQAILDESLLQARMSQNPAMQALVKDADDNAGGIIAFPDLVEVCRTLGFDIPERE